MLNTKLTETETERRLRMQGMSKDELIERMLKVKVRDHGLDCCLVTNIARPTSLRQVPPAADHLRLAISPEDRRTQSKRPARLTIPTATLQMGSTLVQSTNSSHKLRCMATMAVTKGLLIQTFIGAATPKGCRTTPLPGTACLLLPTMRG